MLHYSVLVAVLDHDWPDKVVQESAKDTEDCYYLSTVFMEPLSSLYLWPLL